MKYIQATLPEDLDALRKATEAAFASTPDASLDQWFSFGYMQEQIKQARGVCIKAVDEQGNIVGVMYAQQESPINGPEGTEKWVINLSAVIPELAGRGIGSALLQATEQQARDFGAKKMFVFTNKGDEQVVRFYEKCHYEYAGWIKDYQYGDDNAAVFLLKYL
jgi:ribosomal protein S18 acetylase RimI-like enzyme